VAGATATKLALKVPQVNLKRLVHREQFRSLETLKFLPLRT
jgi:hypothetical protein